ncbi:MAG: hypothetical protein P8R54_07205, partial [Myxococcota bacterium]|nr:hypothetical protein [Myxococcota bacterium]
MSDPLLLSTALSATTKYLELQQALSGNLEVDPLQESDEIDPLAIDPLTITTDMPFGGPPLDPLTPDDLGPDGINPELTVLDKPLRKQLNPLQCDRLTGALTTFIDEGIESGKKDLKKWTKRASPDDVGGLLSDQTIQKPLDKMLKKTVGKPGFDKVKIILTEATEDQATSVVSSGVVSSGVVEGAGVYADPSKTYEVCTNPDAWIREDGNHSHATEECVPKNVLCEVLNKDGNYYQVCYQVGGQERTVWTSKTNFGGALKGEDKASILEGARDRADAKSGFFCTPKGATLYDGEFSTIDTLPPGALGRIVGIVRPKGTKTDYAQVEVVKGGQTLTGTVKLDDLTGRGPLSASDYEALKQQRMDMLAGESGEHSLDEIKESTTGGDFGDEEIIDYRNRRREGLDTQSTSGQLHTTDVSVEDAFAPYQAPLKPHSGEVSGEVYRQVHEVANRSAFAEPGEDPGKVAMDAARLAALQQMLLNQYGATWLIDSYTEQADAYWRPRTIKYADGDEQKGILGLFAKKNIEWKTLKKKERKQKMQEWGITKFFHRLFKWKLNDGVRLDEIEWMIASTKELTDFATEQRKSISLSSVVPRDLPQPPEPMDPAGLTGLDDLVAQINPHNAMVGNAMLNVTPESKKRLFSRRDKVIGRAVSAVAATYTQHYSEGGKTEQLVKELGLSVDWADTWESQTSDGGGPAGYLTVTGMPGLLELEVPVYDSLDGTDELGKVHFGDRLAWTGATEKRGSEAWVEITWRDGSVGWVQARYTNGGQVSQEIIDREAAVLARQQRVSDGVLDIDSQSESKQPFATAPAGLKVRGYHVLRQPLSGSPVYTDVFERG